MTISICMWCDDRLRGLQLPMDDGVGACQPVDCSGYKAVFLLGVRVKVFW